MTNKKKLTMVGIMPARMGSSRFPGKPLASIHGMPMIGHVYLRSKMCKSLDAVCVATCDEEIREYITSIGGVAIMTSDKHERASDRAAEALKKMERILKRKVDVAVMIQGDEPMILPRMIDMAVAPMYKDANVLVTNLMSKLSSVEEQEDPNEVKVVVDQQNWALYFSREPIPSRKKGAKNFAMFKQVCVIPFRRDFLLKFNRLKPTPLEIVESVDMLRVLEHGIKVKMVLADIETYSVDTPEDLRCVEKAMRQDKLMCKYHKI